ncbi:MAG: hypothetical protein QOE31_1637 [Solirubrobacteraceae bacterium]|nr:hypothetical protein [Solirubrobacteraceae bacterium]
MRVRLKTAVGAMLVTGACVLTVPAGAFADCTADMAVDGAVNLVDSTPAQWQVESTGNAYDGALLDADGKSMREDAFDSFPIFSVDEGEGRETYANPAGACEYDLDGRQLAFPAYTTSGGLEISRKTYVPAAGPGFARFFNRVSNPTQSARTIDVYTADGEQGSLGSDSNTTLTGTSTGIGAFVEDGNGNLRLDSPVTWLTTSDGDGSGDPALAHNLDSSGAVSDRIDDVLQEGEDPDSLSFVYRDVTIPAGGTVSYLSFESMRFDDAAAQDAARYLDARPDAAFAGLTSDEMAAVQNWQANGDGDGDGVANAADNCPALANGDQSDLDGDGQGDGCDSDIDGDGILNVVEAAFGTNPSVADSDGDGVRDNADDCPKRAGGAADGCPVATTTNTVTMMPEPRRASSTKVSGKRTKFALLTLRSTGKVTGVAPGSQRCTRGLVVVQVRIDHLTVSRRQAKLKADCSFSSKVMFRHRAPGSRAVRVRATFQGSDRLLPSTSKRMVVR